MVDSVRDALGMFYSLNGLVKSDTCLERHVGVITEQVR